MKCNKCQGQVMIDKTFDRNLALELFCLSCGKRWTISRTSLLGRALDEAERRNIDG